MAECFAGALPPAYRELAPQCAGSSRDERACCSSPWWSTRQRRGEGRWGRFEEGRSRVLVGGAGRRVERCAGRVGGSGQGVLYRSGGDE